MNLGFFLHNKKKDDCKSQRIYVGKDGRVSAHRIYTVNDNKQASKRKGPEGNEKGKKEETERNRRGHTIRSAHRSVTDHHKQPSDSLQRS